MRALKTQPCGRWNSRTISYAKALRELHGSAPNLSPVPLRGQDCNQGSLLPRKSRLGRAVLLDAVDEGENHDQSQDPPFTQVHLSPPPQQHFPTFSTKGHTLTQRSSRACGGLGDSPECALAGRRHAPRRECSARIVLGTNPRGSRGSRGGRGRQGAHPRGPEHCWGALGFE